nr:hypothetical protein [Tanacetum cinerariifolium]
ETYKNVSQEIRDQLNAEAEAVQIILTGIDNDIYSTVDACPNACAMWKAIERFVTLVKQNQELKTVLYHKLYDTLKQHQHEVNEIRAERIAHVANLLALVAQQQPVYHPQTHPSNYTQNSSTRSQQAATRNRGKSIVNSPTPIYDQERSMVAEVDKKSKDKDNSLRINRSVGYENQTIGNVAGARETVGSTVEKTGIQLNAEQADWRDDTDDDDELENQELEAHYMYMAQLQEVSPDAADSGPIFDNEPLQKVSNDDHYNVFAIESAHPEQSESVLDTYPIIQDAYNVIIDSLDMSYDREEIDQNDNDNDLANERELLAFLIEKLKCEIDENKNRNKFLETSNKVLIEKLKGEIEDFKNKNKSLESSNNYFKEANKRLSETNKLLYTDYKKSKAELARRNSMEYASQMEIECAKKEAQIKLNKTREDKELDKVISLENKVKVLDNIVYKTGQSVQTMNMLNNKCRTSFAKPEFLKKDQRANPRLYDIGCYNDNLTLMLALESDEVIRLEKESRSKLSDLIRPFDYNKLNNLYDLFIPQREKNLSKEFREEHKQYFEFQDLKAQLQDKGIVISELKKLIEKLKGKSVDTKFEKSSVIQQPNAFKSQRPSILGKPITFSNSFERRDFSKSKSVTQNNVSNDFSKPVTAQTLPPNKKLLALKIKQECHQSKNIINLPVNFSLSLQAARWDLGTYRDGGYGEGLFAGTEKWEKVEKVVYILGGKHYAVHSALNHRGGMEYGTTTTTLTTTADTTVTTASIRPKAKGLVIHEQVQAPTPIVSSQQPSYVKNFPLSYKLKKKKKKEERLAREKAQHIEEVNIAWDDIQEKIDADYQWLKDCKQNSKKN